MDGLYKGKQALKKGRRQSQRTVISTKRKQRQVQCLFLEFWSQGVCKMPGMMSKYYVGKVTEKQELCLQTHKEFLMDEMEGQVIVEKLCSNFIFSLDDKEKIVGTEGSRTRKDLNRRILDTLMMRGPAGFDVFLQALKDTGHKKAFTTLCLYLDSSSPDSDSNDSVDSSDDETEDDPALTYLKESDDNVMDGSRHKCLEEVLCAMSHMKTELMDVLSLRVTRMDSDQQSEIDRLRRELREARDEVSGLRNMNETLHEYVDERSEQLTFAEKEITELKQHVLDMEAEKEEMQKKFKKQTKKLENLQTRIKQYSNKIKALENVIDELKSSHKREMCSLKRQQKEDFGNMNLRLSKEQEKRKDTEKHFKEHKQETEVALAEMKERISQMLDPRIQNTANIPKDECSQKKTVRNQAVCTRCKAKSISKPNTGK